jgi:hypothetical protein
VSKRRKKVWWVTNRDRRDEALRGPFKHPETAGAVRAEMEQRRPYAGVNLGVIETYEGERPEWPDEDAAAREAVRA